MKIHKKLLLSIIITTIIASFIVLKLTIKNTILAYGQGRGRGAQLKQTQEDTTSTTQETYYTWDEIKKHNTPNDCWMVFEDKVYDVTKYLPEHDSYMDIRPWCGKDITEDFKTKAGTGEDHRPYAYKLLNNYYIGKVKDLKAKPSLANTQNNSESKSNLIYTLIPFGGALIIYFISKILKNNKKLTILQYNFILNTFLAIFGTLSAIFGFLIMVGHKNPNIYKIINVKKAHIWTSFAFASFMLTHFIDRLKMLLLQGKSFKKFETQQNKKSKINNMSKQKSKKSK